MVPFRLCPPDAQTEGQVVLSSMPRLSAKHHESRLVGRAAEAIRQVVDNEALCRLDVLHLCITVCSIAQLKLL